MAQDERNRKALSHVLDELEQSVEGKEVRVQHVIDTLGHQSFPALMLIFSLISTSPASAIPGITAVVALIVFLLVVQMIIGRDHVWLPDVITRRKMDSGKLCKGIRWLRRPTEFVEKFARPRWTALTHRPWLWLPLILVLFLTLFMPFMEIVPTSGSVASAAIAFFSAGLLTRDGVLIALAPLPLRAAPVIVYTLGA
ncbi:exopolysaccharide biosynthesis protein [Pararhodobacter marinus]|uniref:exopolysaccharide biosynthesis protein n=1 Tax=Pararhodobacter marinus TaxID=2184063 RepID=UPI003512B0F0